MVQNSLAIQKSKVEQTEGEGEEGKNFLIFRCREQGGFLARFHLFEIHVIMSPWQEQPLIGSRRNATLISHIKN